VGKTTLARVLAMALNCPDRTAEGEPCGECESCTRIWGGHTALDVVEIDAASNRGVDDARDLRERAMYAPSADGRHKIYIVDEAHMLTREAWNALLKIIEEPPPRVIFVFATTEPQKIQQSAAPILSRCQRFDFRRIGIMDIVSRLGVVLEHEGMKASPDALRLIARKADGGMRDALSLLDQVIALTGGDVEADAVRRVLGLVEEERYVELLDILSGEQHAEVFGLVERLVDEGYDLVEFYHGLLDVLRTVLRLRLSPDAELDLPPELHDQFAERAARFEAEDLVRMLAAAAELEAQGSLRRSPNPRVLIEMLLLRLSYIDRTVAIEELISALGGAPLSSGSAGAGGEGGAGGPGARSRAGASAPTLSQPSRAPADQPALDLAKGPPAAPSATEEPANVITPASGVAEAWVQWLDAGRRVPKGLSAFLRSAHVVELPDGTLEVTPLPGPASERLGQPAVLREIGSALEPHLGRPASVVLGEPSPGPSNGERLTEEIVREDTLKALFHQEPRLERAVEELDLELMD
jgi:DNA polymerase-3 subunit gamma/tau